MKVINGIVGVLSLLGAIYCLCFPGLSFLNTGWIITTILGIYGICHLIFVAVAIGYMIGVMLMVYGVKLIASLFEKDSYAKK